MRFPESLLFTGTPTVRLEFLVQSRDKVSERLPFYRKNSQL